MSSIQVGASSFRRWMREQPSPYSIFAAKTAVEDLAEALMKQFKVEKWEQNIPLKGTLADLPGVPIIKFKDSPWVVAYWSVKRYLDVRPECYKLAHKLDTQVINIWEKDTSGYTEWTFWEKDADEAVEFCERMMPDDDPYLKSRLRKLPKLGSLKGETLKERLFALLEEPIVAQSIYIPGLDLDLADPAIERVDLLTLPSQPLGMRDFQKCIYQGHPEYSIFAVKAAIDLVSPAVAEYCKVSEWKKDIQTNSQIWDLLSQDNKYWMPIAQPQGNDWTVVYWNPGDWKDLTDMCLKLSQNLDTKVMTLGEEDTSSAIGYELFDRGKQIERMEGCPGEEIYFESEIREEPEFDDFEESESDTVNNYIDDIFREEGIYIPSPELSVADEWIARVDLIPQS
jgi:hypothetical protein